MLDLRPVLYINGLMLAVLGVGMTVPALIDYSFANPDWQVFMAASATSLFVAGALIFANRGAYDRLTTRQAFILTVSAWLILPTFGALPFAYSALQVDYAGAYFEAMSGLTTTGATVLVGLDTAPPGILMWRAILNWLGGVGIIAMAIAVLPMLQIAGYQLFRMESSDNSEKIVPRVSQLAGIILMVYVGITIVCIIAYDASGMTFFEAVAHAFATVATGGFSTSDASFGHFNSPLLDFWATLFMALSALPYTLYFQAIRGRPLSLIKDDQVRLFFMVLTGLIGIASLWLVMFKDYAPLTALRYTSFNLVSVITTTGFVSTDYQIWGAFAAGLFFFATFLGGCSGSSAGAIKMFRFRILFSMAYAQARKLLQPSGVLPARYNGRPVPAAVMGSVASFFFLYVVVFLIFTIACLATGVDLITAASGVAQAMGNVGPGLGDIIGPAGNCQSLPASTKWLFSLAMLVGRLELLTVLVLFTPGFWRG